MNHDQTAHKEAVGSRSILFAIKRKFQFQKNLLYLSEVL